MTVDEAKEAIRTVINSWAETFALSLEGLAKKINLTAARASGAEARLNEAEARIEMLERKLEALTRQGAWIQ